MDWCSKKACIFPSGGEWGGEGATEVPALLSQPSGTYWLQPPHRGAWWVFLLSRAVTVQGFLKPWQKGNLMLSHSDVAYKDRNPLGSAQTKMMRWRTSAYFHTGKSAHHQKFCPRVSSVRALAYWCCTKYGSACALIKVDWWINEKPGQWKARDCGLSICIVHVLCTSRLWAPLCSWWCLQQLTGGNPVVPGDMVKNKYYVTQKDFIFLNSILTCITISAKVRKITLDYPIDVHNTRLHDKWEVWYNDKPKL